MSAPAEATPKLTKKDFTSDQEVRWCPGCGDYAILAAIQRTMPELGTPKENTVFVSGIGCAARFPYYMNTYGFHTIHGRAPAFATGMKIANPELDIWIITGDGDSLSIGGNHLLHLLRRNVDVQLVLFNNQIYGLTKGQFSPTSGVGMRTPSTPMGSIDPPVSPVQVALGAGARFVARGLDTDLKHLPQVLKRSKEHKGASFLEVFQNCIVFNDKAFEAFTNKQGAKDTQIRLEHGQPLLYGAEGNKGLRMKPGVIELETVTVGEDGITEDDILVHDETNRVLAGLLGDLRPPFPVAIGVLYCNPAVESYEESVHAQVAHAKASKGVGDFNALLRSGHTWEG